MVGKELMLKFKVFIFGGEEKSEMHIWTDDSKAVNITILVLFSFQNIFDAAVLF